MGKTLSLPLKGKHIIQWGRQMCTQLTIIKYGEQYNGDLPKVSWEHRGESKGAALEVISKSFAEKVISELPFGERIGIFQMNKDGKGIFQAGNTGSMICSERKCGLVVRDPGGF